MTMACEPYIDPAAERLLTNSISPRKAVFLDRDGVINVNHGYVHTPKQTDWVPGIFELVAAAQRRGYLIIVVTNQAGIGRGYYDTSTFLAYTEWMHAHFTRQGTPVLATFWCPHHPEAGIGEYRVVCGCRKPEPGMLLAAMERFGIEPSLSLMVGDSVSDVAAAHAAGVRGILLGQDDWGASMSALLGALA